MGTVHIVGDELVALAAALRLAQMRHKVTIISSSPRWLESAERPLAPQLGATLQIPSAWRDLFAKSGRAMEAELVGIGLNLVTEPDTQISSSMADISLPTDRGAQIHTVRDRYDTASLISGVMFSITPTPSGKLGASTGSSTR